MLKLNNLSGEGTPSGTIDPPPSSPGNMYVWGNNDSGQLGLGTTTTQDTPILNATITEPIFKGQVSSASMGVFISDGLTDLEAAGENSLGQLADGTMTDQLSFTPTSVLSSVVTFINGGGDTSIYSDGGVGIADIASFVNNSTNAGLHIAGDELSDWSQEVDCWDWLDGFVRAEGTMDLTCAPCINATNNGAVGIFFSSLSVTDEPFDGRTKSVTNSADILFWGDTLAGSVVAGIPVLGTDTFDSNNFDRSIKIAKVVAISNTTTLVMDENGGGFSFSSSNTYGEVGQNKAIDSFADYATFKIGFESGVTDIAGNEFNSFMIKDGAIFASGSFQTGCVGTATANVLDPIQLGSATDWVEIQAGEACLIARNAANELWFIGNNTSSQKGVAPDGITNALTLMDSPNTYSAYLVTLRSVYAIRE